MPEPTNVKDDQAASSACLLQLEQYMGDGGPIGRDFIILQHRAQPSETAAAILANSFSVNHVKNFSWSYEQLPGQGYVCSLLLDDVALARGTGGNKAIAKRAVAQVVLNRLRECCHTVVQLRGSSDYIDSPTISKDDVFIALSSNVEMTCSEAHSAAGNRISTDSVGGKLMQKLGWQGGGLGKSRDGIQQPVQLEGVINRAGLGFKSSGLKSGDPRSCSDNMKAFRDAVTRILSDYASSDNETDIVFSADFSSEERKIIHELARKFALISKSYGSESNRVLTVKRRRTPIQLLEYVVRAGGSNENYQIIGPTCKPCATPCD